MRARVVPVTLGLVAVLGVAAAPAAAQAPYDSTAFHALAWREIGIFRGGRSVTAAGSGARRDEYWMGTTGGGVFKTTDGGNTWLPATDKYFGGTIGSIAVSASNPDVVWVGTGEYPVRGNVSHGDGVFRTTDAGRHWTSLGLAATQQIARVVVHPTNPDVAWVAALGHAFGPNPERGVYRTADGGKSWTQVLFRNDSTGASDLAIDPSNPDVLYAALWQVQRTPWGLSSGGKGGGLFKTTDGGAHWTELTANPGLPRGLWGNVGVAVSPAKPSRVWAIVEADSGGVYRSDDGGATWTRVNRDHRLRQRAWYYMRLAADPKDSNTVWAVNTGLFRSKDGGASFEHVPDPHGDNHDLWIAPNDPQRMIESNDGGSNVSTNGGTTWTDQDYATAQFYHVVTTNHFPYRVCGAQQDNSGVCGPSRWPGGITRAQWYDVSGESGYIVARPDSADITYGGDNSGFLARVDHRTGFWRMVSPWPDDPDGHPASEGRYRFQWTAPLLISPHDPHTLYAGANVLFRTTDGGQSWTAISPDLTRHDPRTLGVSGGPITLDQTTAEYYGTIFALAESPLVRGTIWAGSDDGLIHLTRNGGRTWTDVTPRDLAPFTRISIIEASHFAPGTAYVAANRYQLDDPSPIVLVTRDYGRTWSRIADGIPADEFVRTVREDPAKRGLLFAGTERGVWVSFDDGGHWQSLRRNLPIVPVHDLALKDGDLIAATHGRSFWILDDITPLESLTRAVAQEDAHLYPVRDAWRVDWGGSDAGSDAHPVGKNPPSGAIVYYALKTPGQAVTLTFLDSAGRVIRRFTSRQDSIVAADSARAAAGLHARRDSLMHALGDSVKVDSILGDTTKDGDKPWPQRPPAPPRVSDKAGLNRFAWNLRYPGPAVFWGMNDIEPNGPVAPPGRYRVRLEVGGRTWERTFRLKPDPRSVVTPAALREQFAFLARIRDTVNAVTTTVIRLRNVRAQLEDRAVLLAAGTPARVQAEALAARLGADEDSLYQVRLQADEDNLVFPSRAVERISSLADVVGGTDARPTAASYDVFRLFAPDVQRALLAARASLTAGLAAVNGALAGAGQPAVAAADAELRPPRPVD
ncbi:MAG TPA: glycosyl hydrolase [Gemmatimonadales bacterium]|nr:glycosyl hydrolase [Gemmatimonadales bacterium]